MRRALNPQREIVHNRAAFMAFSFLLMTICTAHARILRTRPTPSETWDPLLPLTIGSGIDFETNSKSSQYDLPFLLEYNFTEPLRMTIEPNVVHIHAKTKTRAR
jgi:hypothetical protein